MRRCSPSNNEDANAMIEEREKRHATVEIEVLAEQSLRRSAILQSRASHTDS